MKKLIGLLLTCTAFAYTGERVVLDLPPAAESYQEAYGDDYAWQGWDYNDSDCIAVESHLHGEHPITLDSYLDSYFGQLEIIDQDESSVILIGRANGSDKPLYAEKFIVTDVASHSIEYWFDDPYACLPYLQNAHVGTPEKSADPYEGNRLALSSTEEWELQSGYSTQSDRAEFWVNKDADLEILITNEPQDEMFSIHDYYVYYRGYLDALSCDQDFDAYIMEQSDMDMLLRLEIDTEKDGIETVFVRLLVTPTSRHACLAFGEDEGLLIEALKNMELAE